MKIESPQGDIELFVDQVLIRKTGPGVCDESTVAINDISETELILGTLHLPGYFVLTSAAGRQFRGGHIEASQDPHAFVFDMQVNMDMQAFRRKLRQAKAGLEDNLLAAARCVLRQEAESMIGHN